MKSPNKTEHGMIRTKRRMIFWVDLRRIWIEKTVKEGTKDKKEEESSAQCV